MLNNNGGKLAYNRCSNCDVALGCAYPGSCVANPRSLDGWCASIVASYRTAAAPPTTATPLFACCQFSPPPTPSPPHSTTCPSFSFTEIVEVTHWAPDGKPTAKLYTGCGNCAARFGCAPRTDCDTSSGCRACPSTAPFKHPSTRRCSTCQEISGTGCIECYNAGLSAVAAGDCRTCRTVRFEAVVAALTETGHGRSDA